MRSIFAKVVLWSLGTFALSLVAFWVIARVTESLRPNPGDFFGRVMRMIEDDTCRAYEEGGPPALDDRLARLDAALGVTHVLTDPSGRDLARGVDRSDLLRNGQSPPVPPRLHEGKFILVHKTRGGRYRFISIVPPWPSSWNILPYYGAIVVVILVMGATLAAHLAAPLRRLRAVVDRFGGGDLAARAGPAAARNDEIGALARSFDDMAGRITTLLAAERRLLQDVSHELRSPLARLGFAIELARTGDDRASALDRIQKDVNRLSVLVNELLELTRAEGDPSGRVKEAVPLGELVGTLVDDCGLEAEARGCRLNLRIQDAGTVQGEPELLRRAVENVLRNAIRYAPQESVVDVDLHREDGRSFILVRDRGVGVPEDAVEAIFQPFFRADGDRSRSSGGVGLGLAIARRAVHLHEGTITATNAHPGLAVAIELPNDG